MPITNRNPKNSSGVVISGLSSLYPAGNKPDNLCLSCEYRDNRIINSDKGPTAGVKVNFKIWLILVIDEFSSKYNRNNSNSNIGPECRSGLIVADLIRRVIADLIRDLN